MGPAGVGWSAASAAFREHAFVVRLDKRDAVSRVPSTQLQPIGPRRALDGVRASFTSVHRFEDALIIERTVSSALMDASGT